MTSQSTLETGNGAFPPSAPAGSAEPGGSGFSPAPRDLPVIQATEAARLPVAIEAARQLLAECQTDLARVKVRDEARAWKAYAAARPGLREIETECSILVLEAEREIARANPPAKGGRGKPVNAIHGFTPAAFRQVRAAHARVSDDRFSELAARAREAGEPLTREGLRGRPASAQGNAYEEWHTPERLIEAAREVMGGIDCDPASNEDAQTDREGEGLA